MAVGGIMDALFRPGLKGKTRKPWSSGRKSSSKSSKDGEAFDVKPPVLKQVQQVRKWLSLTPDGDASSLELSKIKVTQQLGIPLRDLRILDPLLATSYPSALLAREKAIVVNLEFIKMIVGMNTCYVTNLDDPNAADFVEHLQHRLKYGPTNTGEEQHPHQKDEIVDGKKKGKGMDEKNAKTLGNQSKSYNILPPVNPLPELPFELRVLETALDYISKYLEQQVSDLEASGHPALDALTQKISTSNLERVRRIKNRMVRLNTRIETVRLI